MNCLKKILIPWFLVILFSSCNKNEEEIHPQNTDKLFIYNVAETKIPYTRFSVPPNLNEVTIEKIPVISPGDIEFYDYSAHYIYLTKNAATRVKNNMLEHGFFMVTSGSDRIYLGSYHPVYSSIMPQFPYISTPLNWTSINERIIAIQFMSYPGDTIKDPRFNSIIHETLERNNILREGISVDIENIKITKNQISFTLSITNKEENSIWVLDPDNKRTLLYYSSAPYLLNDTNQFFQNNNDDYPASITWKKDYYTKIFPGRTLSRFIIFDNYSEIPDGEYTLYYSYSCPVVDDKIEVNYNERFWMGRITVSKSVGK